MGSQAKLREKKGFMMVVSIFVLVAIVTAAVGILLGALQHRLEIQRVADRNQAYWVAEAGIDRALYELTRYVKVNNKFPDPDAGEEGRASIAQPGRAQVPSIVKALPSLSVRPSDSTRSSTPLASAMRHT